MPGYALSERNRKSFAFALLGLSVLAVALTLGVGVVSAQTQNATDGFQDGFEDQPTDSGFAENWSREGTHNGDFTVNVSDTQALVGNQSFYADAGSSTLQIEPNEMPWNSSLTSNVSASLYQSNTSNIRTGFLLQYNGSNVLRLDHTGSSLVSTLGGGQSETITNDVSDGEWTNITVFNYSFDSETYSVRYETPTTSGVVHDVSMVGSVPSDADGYDSFQIVHATSGGNGGRAYWDEIDVNPQNSSDFDFEVQPFVPHGEERPYTATLDGTDVTDDATVTSSNTTVLTVNETRNVVIATDDVTINDQVEVTAEYEGRSDTQTVTVANATVEHLDILPNWWKVNATLSDWTIIWIIVATAGSIVAVRMSTTFAGIGAFVAVLIMGWFMGEVPIGIVTVAFLMAVFLGLNLGNMDIDYSVGGSR